MNRKQLGKLKRLLSGMRRSPQKSADLIALAKKLGRTGPVSRGKEPTYSSIPFPELRTLTIPKHGGKDLSIGTKNSILDQLEDDINAWDLNIPDEDDDLDDDQRQSHAE